MNSFAFWYKVKDSNPGKASTNQNVEATMNFNLWCQCGWKEKNHKGKKGLPYLDIGFKIKHLNLATTLFLFLPLRIREEEKTLLIEDLGCKFSQTELVDAVFNESYATTIAANKKTIKVESTLNSPLGDNGEHFYIYQLDIEHDLTLESFADGTIAVIETENIINSICDEEDPTYYLRFRIKNCQLDFLIHQYTAPNSAIQSLFNTTYMIDFRYHNIRSLHKTLIERFNKTNTRVVAITSLHFLLMTKAYIDVSVNHPGLKGTRKIENRVWDEYVNNNDTVDLLAYHIVQKPDKSDKSYISSSELFAKFRVEKSIIWIYLIFTIGLGIIGSLVASLLLEFFIK